MIPHAILLFMIYQLKPRIFPDYETLSKEGAMFVFQKIKETRQQKNTCVLGLPTGSTPIGMYKHLVQLITDNRQQITENVKLTTFNLDEYYPIKKDNDQSYHYFMSKHFWNPLATNPTHFSFNIPNGQASDPEAECLRYEQAIKNAGGIDLMILGIGSNGHIGFNEPGSARESRTRLVNIAKSTVQANSRFFNSIDEVPRQAITMGVGTILESREILLLASGKSKKDILSTLLALEKPDRQIPASWLITHPQVHVYMDKEAST